MFPFQQDQSQAMLATLANLARVAKLKQDMAAIEGGGLPNYAGTASQPRLQEGYAPGPYQYNMPGPGASADPEAAARDRVARGGRRGKRMGGWEQRFLDAGPMPANPELQRNTRPTLTPQQFLAERAGKKQAADQALADANAAFDANPANQDLFNARAAAEAAAAPFAAGPSPQERTYLTVRDQRGIQPPDVAANLANREAELASRKKAVRDRGLLKGKAKELGVSPAMAAAMTGKLGGEGNGSMQGIFAQYLAMTRDPKMAALLAQAHIAQQNADPIRDQLMAIAGQSPDPAMAKRALDMAMARSNGSNAVATPEIPGNDPAKTEAAVEEAKKLYPKDPLKQMQHVVANSPGTSEADAEKLIKQKTPAGKVFDRAGAAAAKRKSALDVSRQYFGEGPTAVHAGTLGPIIESMLPIFLGSDAAGSLNSGIVPPPAMLPQRPVAPPPQYNPFPMFPGA